jgi:membrane protein implicated in regulation of membrane protease activity
MTSTNSGWTWAILLGVPLCCGAGSLIAAGGLAVVASFLAAKGALLLALGALLVALVISAFVVNRRRSRKKPTGDAACDC